ncbi:hypothetical protein HPB51_001913 [Rhipicephalus microplus]|uniref:Uncharacterized protein n=1 Tax=Rhipicephalus microplus TaxID=6941 RepID=A0A9J6DY88_RHIMP|nr:hypothetical protein HPB51_001913 [Rhipicephalus microplus]
MHVTLEVKHWHTPSTGDGFSMGKNVTARRMFWQQWLQDPNLKDWVAPSEKGEAFVRCKICSCDIRAHCPDLTKHAETMKHHTRIAPKDEHQLRDVAPVLAVEEEQKKMCFENCLFTACLTSIRCVDELSDLLKGELKYNLVMHRTKCTALIRGVLGPCFSEYLRKDISMKPYSLLTTGR